MYLTKAVKRALISYILISMLNFGITIYCMILERLLIASTIIAVWMLLTTIIFIFFQNQPPIVRKLNHYDEPTRPKLPITRHLSEQELLALKKHYPEFMWSHVDSNNHILLTGQANTSIHYITPKDLERYY